MSPREQHTPSSALEYSVSCVEGVSEFYLAGVKVAILLRTKLFLKVLGKYLAGTSLLQMKLQKTQSLEENCKL